MGPNLRGSFSSVTGPGKGQMSTTTLPGTGQIRIASVARTYLIDLPHEIDQRA